MKLSELASMGDESQANAIGLMASQMRASGTDALRTIHKTIAQYEQRHNMTSQVMLERVASGDLDESADVCSWLLALKKRDRLETATRSSPQ